MNGKLMIVVHGGVGEPLDKLDGCERAAQAGMVRLQEGEDAMAAALAAAVLLEDDPRFDAGTGSDISMDGKTVEMDAAVMDTRGRLGAVACIERVKNPVLVAHALTKTPHTFLAGNGATGFARMLGFADYDPITEEARLRHRQIMQRLCSGDKAQCPVDWQHFPLAAHWNFPSATWEEIVLEYGHGTIGAVARDAEGHFAACVSTGGFSPMLYGRVGDTPLPGSGYFAGPLGAVAATGIGEHLTRAMISRTVYSYLEAGLPLQEALDRGIALLPPRVDAGLIGVTATEAAFAANRDMPAAFLTT